MWVCGCAMQLTIILMIISENSCQYSIRIMASEQKTCYFKAVKKGDWSSELW